MKIILNKCVSVALLSIVAVVLSLNFTSCEKYGIDSQQAMKSKLGITAQSSYTVSSTGPREIKFTVTSNTLWTITSDQSWCAPSPTSSTVSALISEITVVLEDNEKLESRSALLTIQGEGVEKQEITIIQSSKGILEVAMFETDVRFKNVSEGRKFTVKSTKDWTVISDKAWLTFNVSSVEGSNKVNEVIAEVEENNANIRRATITINNGLEEKTYEVVQDGNQLEILNMDDSKYNYAGDIKVYQLQANIAWVAETMPGSEWINITSATSGDGNGELVVEINANPIFIERRGQVRVKPKKPVQGLEDVIIDVVQDVAFSINKGTITFTEEGAAVIATPNSRLVSKLPFGLGIHTWKFTSVNIPDGSAGYFDINGWPDVSPSTANYHIWLRNANPKIIWGGGFKWNWANNKLELGTRVLNDLKTLTLKLEPDTEDADKLIYSLYFNGDLIREQSLTNVYANPAEEGVKLYFGLLGGGEGELIIESFTSTPLE